MFDNLKKFKFQNIWNSICQFFKACSFEKLMKHLDWFTIPVGIASIIVNLVLPSDYPYLFVSTAVTVLAAALCVLYLAYAAYLWRRRPVFDFHMVNGSFMRRVCCLVLLTPAVMTVLGFVIIESQKELVYDGNLYEQTDSLTTHIYQKQTSPNLYWTTYFHFIDPGNQHMTTTKTGRVWAALIGILGVFLLNGLLVSSMMGWIDSRKDRWLKGEVKYRRFLERKSHYVIVGGNDMLEGIVKQILAEGKYVLILTSRDVESFRRELFSNFNDEEQNRIIIYYGSMTSKEDIAELCLCNAIEVYILGENVSHGDDNSYHDTLNMQCLRLISDEMTLCDGKSRRRDADERLVCRVMFEYQTSFNLFQVTDIDGDRIRFLPFNCYEMCAQNVFVCRELEEKCHTGYYPLEGMKGIKSDDDTYVHLIVVGMSRMGVAMGIEAAHLAHYPNYEPKKIRTRITFIDKKADVEKNFFMGRFRELFSLSHWSYGEVVEDKLNFDRHSNHILNTHLGGDFIDIEWEFIKGSVEIPAVQKYITDSASDKNARVTIAVCLPENNSAIAAAAYLPQAVYQSESTLQVLVYQRLNDELLHQLNECDKRYNHKLKAFGMAKDSYDTTLVDVAESIGPHLSKAYRRYSWNMLFARYKGEGLIDEDYSKLTGSVYNPRPKKNAEEDDTVSLQRQAALKAMCDKWMDEHFSAYKSGDEEPDYNQVQQAMNLFVREVKSIYNTDENLPQSSSNGKSKAATMWSNHYNIYTMWTKFRSVRTADEHVFNPLMDDSVSLTREMIDQLGAVEHNRWVVEQLLLRFRPLDESEQNKAMIVDLYGSSEIKTYYKKNFNAHLDICSNKRLDEVDYNIGEVDKEMIAIMPSVYRDYMLKA